MQTETNRTMTTVVSPINEFVTNCLGSIENLKALWNEPLHNATTVWPQTAINHMIWASLVGTGLDKRIRMLAKLHPAPTAVPEPTPWKANHICGAAIDRTCLSYSHAISINQLDESKKKDAINWLISNDEEADIAWNGLRKLRRLIKKNEGIQETELQELFSHPLLLTACQIGDVALINDINTLTEMAISVLLHTFADVPANQRHTEVGISDIIEMGHLRGEFLCHEPDLILGDTLIEIKTVKEPDITSTAKQLAHLVLQDRYDRYAIRNIACYFARQGVLISLPVSTFFPSVNNIKDIELLREQYRVIRGQIEERLLLIRSKGRGEINVVTAFLTHVLAHSADLIPFLESRFYNSNTKVRKMFRLYGLTNILDAVRGLPLAIRYNQPEWISSINEISEIFTEDRLTELIELVRSGPQINVDQVGAQASSV